MVKNMKGLLLASSCVAFVTPAVAQQTSGDYRNLTVEERRSAIKAIAVSLERDERLDLAVLPQVESAFRDTDPEVRRNAFEIVGLMSLQAHVARQKKAAEPFPPAAVSSLEDEIRAGMTDSDPQTRALATNALLLVAKPDAELELTLIEQYQPDTSALVREQAIARLGDIAPGSAAADAALLEALGDPDGRVVQQAAIAVERLTPGGGADKAVEILRKAVPDDPGVRASLVSAVAAYGGAAQAHLPYLRELLRTQHDQTVRAELTRAISRLSQP